MDRAEKSGGGFIVAGSNYGQGSSREHAALAPMYLGVRGVVAKSFARIHRSNLINFGIAPFTFKNLADYDLIQPGNFVHVSNVRERVGKNELSAEITDHDSSGRENLDAGYRTPVGKMIVPLKSDLTAREASILLAGGLLNFTKTKSAQS